jgi:pyruvate dehydrogenase E1 component
MSEELYKKITTAEINPSETQEWLAAIDNVLANEGQERAQFLLGALAKRLGDSGFAIASGFNPDYVNTISVEEEPEYPGDLDTEKRIDAMVRWNAAAMVVRAGRIDSSLGGHLATFASSATLYEVGMNHYFRGQDFKNGGDLIYFQGHASPGMYARSFLEGRLSEQQLNNFRREIGGHGLSSYPHPYLMPDYWQFPTVSMGLGPLQGIYQAKFLKYLHNRGLQDTDDRKVWVFCGDGEMDEPESTGGLMIAGREKLDNLVFVVNCNLQKLDGPVAGNDQIATLLSKLFQGAGWNVLKVLWGSSWDPLFEKDSDGLLVKAMNESVDGEYQNYRANDGAYVRDHFFAKFPKLKEMVSDLSDDDIMGLRRGGHDPMKVNAAYNWAQNNKNGKPTVILAMTVKGFALEDIQGSNNAHNIKKMTNDQLKAYRDRLNIPLTDKQVEDVSFYHPGEKDADIQYMKACREKLHGFLPARRQKAEQSIPIPALSDKIFSQHLEGSEGREISSNMAYARIFTSLLRDKELKNRIVPIVPDECRTLAMEGLFAKIGLYSVVGQKYDPVDSGQLIYYKESKKGQILNEGLSEDGATCEMMAAGTSYSSNNYQMIPFYLYYSMFGFQRVGDLAWAAGDMKMRGFFVGSLSGRTTLAGEGLQHLDGQSTVQASIIPSCRTYDPTWGYELAIIMQNGLQRMMQEQEDVFFYITVGNEKYAQEAMPKGLKPKDVIKGLYLYQKGKPSKAKDKVDLQVQLLGSGAILRESIFAAQMLHDDFGVCADVWSATSFNELRRDGLDTQHWNLYHPAEKAKQAYVAEKLLPSDGPIVAATDFMKIYADQIREFLPGKTFLVLGTDGYGRSDTRTQLRNFFEVDRRYIAYTAIKGLVDEGRLPVEKALEAIEKYGIDPSKPNPVNV